MGDAGAVGFVMRALGEEDARTRDACVAAAVLMDSSALMPKLEHYLDTDGDGENDHDRADRTAAGIALVMGGIAERAGDAAMAKKVADRCTALLVCPNDMVQVAVANGLASCVRVLGEGEGKAMLEGFLAVSANGALAQGYGLAGVVKGLKTRSLVAHGVLAKLEEKAGSKKDQGARELAVASYGCLARVLGHTFEPYTVKILPTVLAKCGDKVPEVRAASEGALKACTECLCPQGLRHIFSLLLRELEDRGTAWQSKVALLQCMESWVSKEEGQMGRAMQGVVPAVCETLNDTKPEVCAAAQSLLRCFGERLIKSPEMKGMVPALLDAFFSPMEKTVPCVDQLMDVTFINAVDGPCLSLMVPVLSRALKEKRMENRRKASLVVGNMCGLVTDGAALVRYAPSLVPELLLCVKDSNPEMRQYGASALAALLKGMASAHLSARFDELETQLEQLQKDMVSESEETKRKGEKGIQELVDIAMGQATKTNHSEADIEADMQKMKLEEEEKKAAKAKAAEDAKAQAAAEAAKEEAAKPIPGKGFCETSCRVCPQCALALEEQAARDEQKKKDDEKQARLDAKKKAEEEKLKALKKFQEQQKAALAAQGKKKKK
uniref:TOG domain-containing protein n=1 Tax=Hemiselmis tepida TaxID=464990 RepID=A0A7S0VV54_9CRYP